MQLLLEPANSSMLLKRTIWLLLLLFAFHAGALAQQAAPAPCHSGPSCLPERSEESQPDESSAAPPSDPAILSLTQYKAELDRLIQATDTDENDLTPEQAHDLNLTVPQKWTVTADSRTFEVSSVWIKLVLGNIKADKPDENEKLLDKLQVRLIEMRHAADQFDKSSAETTTEKTALTAILARKEFQEVHNLSWIDRLKAKALQWLFSVISRIFGAQSFPTISRIIVWTIVAMALIALALMVYRVMKNNARIEGFVPKIVPVSAKPWSQWMAEARAAAARGEWREAIHLSYWAGVSLLEARGMWKPDRARTPREYLRLLTANSEFHPTLTQLTRRFEVTWYGYKVADEQAFSQALAELEKLGCR